VILKAVLGTAAFTLPAAPELFWQCVQWQARSSAIGAPML
jgi:hypothetical protein